METSQLIERFLEETDYQSNKDIMLMMAYGSRVTGFSTDASDLDILIITSDKHEARISRFVDGIPIEISIIPIDRAEHEIVFSNMTRSAYFDSVLKTGIVLVDNFDTYDNLCELLNQKVSRSKKVTHQISEEAECHIFDFLYKKGQEKVHYYSGLEALRKIYHAQNGYSNIQSPKVYDLYTNLEKAKKNYHLKMPDDGFIKIFLSALREKDHKRRTKFLLYFYGLIEKPKDKLSTYDEYMSDIDITRRLIYLNKAVCKCEDMLLREDPYGNALYYILLSDILKFAGSIYEDVNEIERLYEFAIDADDVESRIRSLEKLFCRADRRYRIDYDDYSIKW